MFFRLGSGWVLMVIWLFFFVVMIEVFVLFDCCIGVVIMMLRLVVMVD